MFPPSFYLNSNPGLLIPLSRIPPAFFHFHSPSLPPLPRLTAVFSSLPLFSFPFRIKIPCSVNNRVQRDHRYRSRIITQTQLHVLFFFRRFYFFFFIHFPSLLSFGKINFRIDKRIHSRSDSNLGPTFSKPTPILSPTKQRNESS